MQLDKFRPIRTALAAATSGLLGIIPHTVKAESSDATQIDSAALYYSEKNRITVSEATVLVTRPLGEGDVLTVRPTIDSITGASPTGASVTDKSQTIAGETTPAGQLPVKSLVDRRVSLDLGLDQQLTRTSKLMFAGNISSEQDYTSIGISGTFTLDVNDKHTTITTGIGGNVDTVEPASGTIPQPLSVVNFTGGGKVSNERESEDDKPISIIDSTPHTATFASGFSTGGGISSGSSIAGDAREKRGLDAILGVTQVINRRTLIQLNYSVGQTSGYLTDPYKIISMVDSTTGNTSSYLTESRPEQRLRQSLYWKTVLHLPEDVIHLSYRYYWDNWNIKSHTVDFRYHLDLGSHVYLEPSFRYYNQTNAYFFRYSLYNNEVIPSFASADDRLALMSSYTYGMKVAVRVGKEGEVALRGSRMQQVGDGHPANAVGVQRSLNLYPGLDAVALQASITIKF